MATPIFQTGVNLDHGAQGASLVRNSLLFGNDLQLEDVELAYEVGAYTPLPDTAVELDSIIENVLKSMPFSSGKSRMIWRQHLKCETCKNIITDCFWWGLSRLSLVKRNGDGAEIEEQFCSRIADNYIRLFYQLPSTHKDQFFGRLYDCLAQITFQAYCAAFRGSRPVFDEDFKLKLVDTFAEWTTGLVPSHPSCGHWAEELASKGSKRRSDNMASLGGRKGTASKTSPGNTQRWNRAVQKTCTLCYSPFVTKFLSNDRQRKALAFRITLTEDPSRPITLGETKSQQRGEIKTVQTRADIVASTRQRRNEILQEYQSARETTLREITTIRKEIAEEQTLLSKKRREVFKGDVHEYSNYLVSLWSSQDEPGTF